MLSAVEVTVEFDINGSANEIESKLTLPSLPAMILINNQQVHGHHEGHRLMLTKDTGSCAQSRSHCGHLALEPTRLKLAEKAGSSPLNSHILAISWEGRLMTTPAPPQRPSAPRGRIRRRPPLWTWCANETHWWDVAQVFRRHLAARQAMDCHSLRRGCW